MKDNNKKILDELEADGFKKIDDLLSQGIDVDSSDLVKKLGLYSAYDTSLLRIAVFFDKVNLVKYLVAKKANVELIGLNCSGSVLYDALKFRHKEIFDFLLESGSNPNAKDVDGYSSIFDNLFAFKKQKNNIEFARQLIKYDLDVNAEYPIRGLYTIQLYPILPHCVHQKDLPMFQLIMKHINCNQDLTQIMLSVDATDDWYNILVKICDYKSFDSPIKEYMDNIFMYCKLAKFRSHRKAIEETLEKNPQNIARPKNLDGDFINILTDIALLIIKNLTPQTLGRLQLVSRAWRDLIDHQVFCTENPMILKVFVNRKKYERAESIKSKKPALQF